MKKTYILILGAILSITSCGMIAQSTSSDDGSRFQDGIYSNSPTFMTKEEKAREKARTDSLIALTKESPIYLFGDRKDTILIPENFMAKLQYDQKVGGTVVTIGENPYYWRWDLENNYGYYYGPYSIGSSWYWSRHYNPYYSSYYGPYHSLYFGSYWNSWSYNPWLYNNFYDSWHYGGFYDPWYYGGYWSGYYGNYWGWHDPWHHYHHHCGWYHPPHHNPGGPSHIAGSISKVHSNRYNGLRARTESYGSAPKFNHTASKPTSTTNTTRPGTGTSRGGMSVGNRSSRASSTAGRSSSTPSYRRPTSSTSSARPSDSSTSSLSGYSRGTSSSESYNRGSSSPSTSYSRSSSSESYNRSSSYPSGSYSRGSGVSSSSSSHSRGSSSGGYRR